ncbi:MAG: hypothetical protein VB142_02000 [Burkholderia sp.]
MLRKLFGASSEKKHDPRQGDLFLNEAEQLVSTPQQPAQEDHSQRSRWRRASSTAAASRSIRRCRAR